MLEYCMRNRVHHFLLPSIWVITALSFSVFGICRSRQLANLIADLFWGRCSNALKVTVDYASLGKHCTGFKKFHASLPCYACCGILAKCLWQDKACVASAPLVLHSVAAQPMCRKFKWLYAILDLHCWPRIVEKRKAPEPDWNWLSSCFTLETSTHSVKRISAGSALKCFISSSHTLS